MSVIEHSGSSLPMSLSNYITFLREAVTILCSQTHVSIHSVVEDSSNEYTVILNLGGEIYAQLSAYYAGSNTSFYFQTGYYDSGNFIACRTLSENGEASSRIDCCKVAVINGGDMWDLTIPRFNNYSWTTYYIKLRGTKLKSGVNGTITVLTGLGSWTNRYEKYPFPSIDDYINVQTGVCTRIRWPDYDLDTTGAVLYTGKNNIPTDSVLLFPYLLSTTIPNNFGVPRIGNKMVYFLTGYEENNIPVYGEFIVEDITFIALGRLAIISE